MAKIKMDATEVASIIHKGDFSKLRGKSFEMCDNKNMRNKYTLNQVCVKLDQIGNALFEFIKTTNTRFENLENRIDKIETKINKIETRIDKIETRINKIETRIDKIETRIDKIEARLDYNGLQMERIEKRLDYNNLKNLPENR